MDHTISATRSMEQDIPVGTSNNLNNQNFNEESNDGGYVRKIRKQFVLNSNKNPM